jgi:hypothetical protein
MKRAIVAGVAAVAIGAFAGPAAANPNPDPSKPGMGPPGGAQTPHGSCAEWGAVITYLAQDQASPGAFGQGVAFAAQTGLSWDKEPYCELR